MIKLAQSYLYFDREHSEEELYELADFMFKVSEVTATEYFSDFSFQVSVRVEEGSTKTWAAISAIAGAIIFYGDLRSSVETIYHDARAVVTYVNESIIQRKGLRHQEIKRTRISSGVPGKLLRLFERVEAGKLSPEEATRLAIKAVGENIIITSQGEAVDLTERFSEELHQVAPEELQGVLFPDAWQTEVRLGQGYRKVKMDNSKGEPSPTAPALRPKMRGILIWRDPEDDERKMEYYEK